MHSEEKPVVTIRNLQEYDSSFVFAKVHTHLKTLVM